MSQMNAKIKQIKGITFAGKTDSSNWIMMDGPEELGGNNIAIRPKELLLLGLGGCTGSDVAVILKKKRIQLESFEMNITAEVSEAHPKVFTKVNIEYLFTGKDLQESDIARAIELSQTKYCSVTKMLEKSMEITHTCKITNL